LMLLDVRPALPPDDETDVRLVNAVLVGELELVESPRGVKPSHLDHVCFGNGSVPIGGSLQDGDATLGLLISHVVGVGPQEEVARLNAGAIVAAVADVKATDGPSVEDERYTVSLLDASVESNDAVPERVFVAEPLPATSLIGRADVPEEFLECLNSLSCHAGNWKHDTGVVY